MFIDKHIIDIAENIQELIFEEEKKFINFKIKKIENQILNAPITKYTEFFSVDIIFLDGYGDLYKFPVECSDIYYKKTYIFKYLSKIKSFLNNHLHIQNVIIEKRNLGTFICFNYSIKEIENKNNNLRIYFHKNYENLIIGKTYWLGQVIYNNNFKNISQYTLIDIIQTDNGIDLTFQNEDGEVCDDIYALLKKGNEGFSNILEIQQHIIINQNKKNFIHNLSGLARIPLL